ncbi:MAG TPA: cytochrome c3 family protein [Acidobacteriota bacterium]|nr:cytochrome c3 family protein [Acidobacteriota bacterium]
MKVFLAGFLLAFLVGLIGFTTVFQKETRQPIQFNHRAHKEIDCSTCHESVKTASFAGLPKIDLCMTCHDSPITKNPEEEKIRILAKQGKPAEWARLFKQPAHVFYSHRRHVEIAELQCKQCHGDIGESTTPPRRVRNLTMSACIACHQQKGVKADCVDCHH